MQALTLMAITLQTRLCKCNICTFVNQFDRLCHMLVFAIEDTAVANWALIKLLSEPNDVELDSIGFSQILNLIRCDAMVVSGMQLIITLCRSNMYAQTIEWVQFAITKSFIDNLSCMMMVSSSISLRLHMFLIQRYVFIVCT
jgi:hypothetical protein